MLLNTHNMEKVELADCTLAQLRQGFNPVVGADSTKCQKYLVKNNGALVGIRSYGYLGKFLANLGYVSHKESFQVFIYDKFQIWELGQNTEDGQFKIIGTYSSWGDLDKAIKQQKVAGLWWKRFDCDQTDEDFQFVCS
jgi:hypothetical protein